MVSVVGLYYGAEWLVRGATTLALSWGVSDRIIGISVVAFGTSVPELATSMMALYRKENDISVGNIIGSNIFNIWAVLGVTAVISPLQVNDKEMLSQDLLISIGFAVLLLLFMLPLSRGVLSRWKGAILFLLYILIYLYFVCFVTLI
jgi:cation:H+ antiporter